VTTPASTGSARASRRSTYPIGTVRFPILS
jgi:hypothetical protein